MGHVQENNRYLQFTIGNEVFAIPLLQVKEVVGTQQITKVPNSPPYMKGVINLRGKVISVIDLGLKFKLQTAKKDQVTIILDWDNKDIGILVDDITSVASFEQDQLSEPPPLSGSVQSSLVNNIAKTGEALTLILNLNTALAA